MKIGELAQRTGVSRDTLRFYEARDLIRSGRSDNNYREYPEEAVELVDYIRTAQRLGFTLQEIGQHMPDVWASADPDHAVAVLLTKKAGQIEQRIAELGALRGEMLRRLEIRCPLRRGEV